VLTNPSITDQELIQFAAAHLANHKIPNQIIILDEIPKGPTGKLQRIGLAEQLGFGKLSMRKNDKKTIFKAPQTKNEKLICNIWQKILDIPKIGINDDFRQIGGDSMLATLIHVEIEAIFGITISLIKLFAARTVYEQSKFIEAELSRSQENVQ
jgi:oxalate---CoA ligase